MKLQDDEVKKVNIIFVVKFFYTLFHFFSCKNETERKHFLSLLVPINVNFKMHVFLFFTNKSNLLY